MMIKRRLGLLTCLVIGLSSAPAAIGVSAASASSTASANPHGLVAPPAASSSDYIAAWKDINRGGQRCTISSANAHWSQICGGINDWASSLWNASRGLSMAFYYDSNYSGAWVCLGPTASFNDLTKVVFNRGGSGSDGYGRKVNDAISSNQWVSSC